LADLIAGKQVTGLVRVQWNPNLNEIWPHSERSWGGSIDNTVTMALNSRGVSGVVVTRDAGDKLIVWDARVGQWTLPP